MKKKIYEPPRLTTVIFKTERGYFVSGYVEQMNLMQEEIVAEEEAARQMEYYTEQENWHSGGEFWN